MELIVLLVLFAPIVYLAVKKKEWYLYLLFAFYPILPDSFAIEISSSLPLLTGSRILILIVMVFWVRRVIVTHNVSIPRGLAVFVFINIMISVINLSNGFGEVNRVFGIVLEQFLLVVILKELINDREVFKNCIDFMIYGCVALAVIGACQSLLDLNPASVLNIVESSSETLLTDRMNMTRAYGTTNAIAYGCYCAFMFPIILYMYERERRFKYIIFALADLAALILTMSRSSLLALCIIMFMMIVIRNARFIKKYIKFFPFIILAVVGAYIIKPSMFDSIIEVIKSCLNVLGADFKLSDDFGLNANNASYSRTVQWTAVSYMVNEGKGLFGYGYLAYVRGCLRYFYRQFGFWTVATTLDVGFVRIATEAGLVGLATYFGYLANLFAKCLNRIKSVRAYTFMHLSMYLIALYVILNVASAFMDAKVFWLFIALIYAYMELKEKYDYECKRDSYSCNIQSSDR